MCRPTKIMSCSVFFPLLSPSSYTSPPSHITPTFTFIHHTNHDGCSLPPPLPLTSMPSSPGPLTSDLWPVMWLPPYVCLQARLNDDRIDIANKRATTILQKNWNVPAMHVIDHNPFPYNHVLVLCHSCHSCTVVYQYVTLTFMISHFMGFIPCRYLVNLYNELDTFYKQVYHVDIIRDVP